MGTYNGQCEKLLPSYTSHLSVVNLDFITFQARQALTCVEKCSCVANCL
jgi:hypothetical protein